MKPKKNNEKIKLKKDEIIYLKKKQRMNKKNERKMKKNEQFLFLVIFSLKYNNKLSVCLVSTFF